MKLSKYRSRPVVKEAVQFDGSTASQKEIEEWSAGRVRGFYTPQGYLAGLRVETLEGNMDAEGGDWIIRGLRGEFYPCKPDVFEKSYELVME